MLIGKRHDKQTYVYCYKMKQKIYFLNSVLKFNLLPKNICLSHMRTVHCSQLVWHFFCERLVIPSHSVWAYYIVCLFFKVFLSFAAAAIRIRMSGLKMFLRPGSAESTDEEFLQYYFGMVLKETMLSLGPTFIKGQKWPSWSLSTYFAVFILLIVFLFFYIWAIWWRFYLSPALTSLPIC